MVLFLVGLGICLLAGAFVAGFLVSRNNPNLESVNKIISAGKAVVDATGKLVKK